MSHCTIRSTTTTTTVRCSAGAFVMTGFISALLESTEKSQRAIEEDHDAVEPTVEAADKAAGPSEMTLDADILASIAADLNDDSLHFDQTDDEEAQHKSDVVESIAAESTDGSLPFAFVEDEEDSHASKLSKDGLPSVPAEDDNESLYDILFVTTEQENVQTDNMNAETEKGVSCDSSIIANWDQEEYVIFDGNVDTIVLSTRDARKKFATPSDIVAKLEAKFGFGPSKPDEQRKRVRKTKLRRIKRCIQSRFARKPKTIRLGMRQPKTKLGKFGEKVWDALRNKKRLDYWKVRSSRTMNSFLSKEESIDLDLDIVDEWNIGQDELSKSNKALFKGLTLENLLAKSDFFRDAWLERIIVARAQSESTLPVSQTS